MRDIATSTLSFSFFEALLKNSTEGLLKVIKTFYFIPRIIPPAYNISYLGIYPILHFLDILVTSGVLYNVQCTSYLLEVTPGDTTICTQD